MRISQSIKYRPPEEWAAGLRSRALAENLTHDPGEWLDAFRHQHPFYAEWLAEVSRWQDVKPMSKDVMAKLPVCTAEPMHETRSSGTSGFQVVVRNSVSERQFRQALAYRPFLFYPLPDVVRQVIFVDGMEVDVAEKQQWPFEFGGRTYLTWRVGIAASLESILELLKLVRPSVIRGLTSGVVRFAEQVGVPLDGLGVRVVSPSGEHLDADWRRALSEAFSAPVLDRYGATEVGSIAWQCPYCGDYHANSDELILESGTEGLLATPLFIESQPLLRYRLGDRVLLHSEAHDCRIRLPKLTVLEARRDDWLIDGAGRKVSPLSFQFEKIAGLKAWRIHQLIDGSLRLYFDTEQGQGSDLGAGAVSAAAKAIRQQLESQLQTIVPGQSYELVAGIWAFEADGKYKRVVSNRVAGSD